METCSDGIAISREASGSATQPEIPTVSTSSEPRTGDAPIFDPFGPDRDCGDFGTWITAQDFYVAAVVPMKTATGWTATGTASHVRACPEHLDVPDR